MPRGCQMQKRTGILACSMGFYADESSVLLDEDVVAGPSVEDVLPGAADQDVVPGAAAKGVVAVTPY